MTEKDRVETIYSSVLVRYRKMKGVFKNAIKTYSQSVPRPLKKSGYNFYQLPRKIWKIETALEYAIVDLFYINQNYLNNFLI